MDLSKILNPASAATKDSSSSSGVQGQQERQYVNVRLTAVDGTLSDKELLKTIKGVLATRLPGLTNVTSIPKTGHGWLSIEIIGKVRNAVDACKAADRIVDTWQLGLSSTPGLPFDRNKIF
ncbi:hypothetical protein N7462_011169 [Penicillium macrosclerotiorum]|uniref:uncharacterized protein n=1 Tax=Penicillium macrosclerotiorum TaxID=303699 RepID=UPI0025472241|nr:uncharacterized protein N7462_011169 [Penicillium macrosclerotiorum]KAJ5666760.1 hypothetical protein N7462_011169 [Penicillium macrosclerotiorum]